MLNSTFIHFNFSFQNLWLNDADAIDVWLVSSEECVWACVLVLCIWYFVMCSGNDTTGAIRLHSSLNCFLLYTTSKPDIQVAGFFTCAVGICSIEGGIDHARCPHASCWFAMDSLGVRDAAGVSFAGAMLCR